MDRGTAIDADLRSRRHAPPADEHDWRDNWVAEGIEALIGCELLGEHSAPSPGTWQPALNLQNTMCNAEAAGRPVLGYTAPGYRRPRVPNKADDRRDIASNGRSGSRREGYGSRQ